MMLLGAAALPAAELVELTAITDYPLLAVSARISGTVRVACRLAADGTVQSVRVLDGPLLLGQQAAKTALLWRFKAPKTGDAEATLDFEYRISEVAVRERPKTSFRFIWPDRAIIESQARCSDHAPCPAAR